ncbi:hypothetical protein ACKUB1_08325 [Methanospirillum stamsii]|uniref:Uncharacterized protein n=1 Tax=Methanospirillum stamsii TaxID=1277351 RepID=A0A2V2N6J9_9EURY|nr:hypothetical protein [Methanospirillum stamsii]PWR75702.1 hypothetical protein DLD82_03735 [Methanospirillum stamsii]
MRDHGRGFEHGRRTFNICSDDRAVLSRDIRFTRSALSTIRVNSSGVIGYDELPGTTGHRMSPHSFMGTIHSTLHTSRSQYPTIRNVSKGIV